MADKCANCGESLSLEPDGNGSLRWYSGTGPDDRSATCVAADGAAKVRGAHVLEVKEAARAATSKGE